MATTGVAVSCTVSRLKVCLTLLPPLLWVSLSLLLPGGSCELTGDEGCPLEGASLMLSPLIAAGQTHLAQEKSRVRCLPGADLESYSGFITVDKPECGSNLFFWFFPAQEGSKNAPLLLWLNGGPGRSSLYGAMFEHGPYQMINTTSESVTRRNVTWVKSFSMLYVDNPVNVGFSHTNSCISRSLNESTANLYSFLQQFFLLFPQYSQNDFYIGGQSFAGKYVPTLAYYIHHQMNSTDKPLMRLRGIFIGSGFCDPETMLPELPEKLYTIGAYSDFDRRQRIQRTKDGWSKPNHNPLYPDSVSFPDLIDYYLPSSFYSYDDQRLETLEEEKRDYSLNGFLNKLPVKNALHAGGNIFQRTRLYNSYSMLEFTKSVRSEMVFLMDHYKVLLYTGNMDIIVNVRMTEAFLLATPWSGQAAYNNSSRKFWWYNDRLAGFFTKVQNFTRVIIRNAGHDAPADQPEWALAMMERFINDKPFRSALSQSDC